MEKQLQAWALKKNIRPVLLDTLTAMHVTCNMFLLHWFGFSESCNDFSFKKSTFLKQKSLRLQKKSILVGRDDVWLSFALHIGLGSM